MAFTFKLTLNGYQQRAKLTATPVAMSDLTYNVLGLSGEAGEVLGVLKRRLRGDLFGPYQFSSDMVKELGDTLWYLAQTCTVLGITLEQVASENLRKLEDRQARGKIKGKGDNR